MKRADTRAKYERTFDGVVMVEIEPGWFVNEKAWADCVKHGVTSCTKKEEDIA